MAAKMASFSSATDNLRFSALSRMAARFELPVGIAHFLWRRMRNGSDNTAKVIHKMGGIATVPVGLRWRNHGQEKPRKMGFRTALVAVVVLAGGCRCLKEAESPSLSSESQAELKDPRDLAFPKAYEHIAKQQWADAVVAFTEMTVKFPADKESWYYLGLANHRLENWSAAIRANEEAAKLPGYVPHRPIYNIACAYARIGKNERALNALEQAVCLGMTDRAHIENDTDLAGLRGEERFKAILASLEQ